MHTKTKEERERGRGEKERREAAVCSVNLSKDKTFANWWKNVIFPSHV